MLKEGKRYLTLILLFFISSSCKTEEQVLDSTLETTPISEVESIYFMPQEEELHEGTWLQWPHQYQFGRNYRNSMDPIWIAMTRELVASENVHVIAYNQTEKERILALLEAESIPLTTIDFKLLPTDDTWVRDNGPIYVRDRAGKLVIEDWGFNGWGNKTDEFSGRPIQFENCDKIPAKIGEDQARIVVDLNAKMIIEGGSFEIDGEGTFMACKSSILNENRNPGMTQTQAERIFEEYLGVTNFVWLDGQAGLEITDQHIDGFARFGNSSTIVTMEASDLQEYDVLPSDVEKLYAATDENGKPYRFLIVPLTAKNVRTTAGINLGYKGSYVNYYVANSKVLVPNYNDPNDEKANEIIQTLYPARKVVGIDVRDLYQYGGMIHCVTQQQPIE